MGSVYVIETNCPFFGLYPFPHPVQLVLDDINKDFVINVIIMTEIAPLLSIIQLF